jgi:hypothetical protein
MEIVKLLSLKEVKASLTIPFASPDGNDREQASPSAFERNFNRQAAEADFLALLGSGIPSADGTQVEIIGRNSHCEPAQPPALAEASSNQVARPPQASVCLATTLATEIRRVWAEGSANTLELAKVVSAARKQLKRAWAEFWRSANIGFSKRKADMLVGIARLDGL